MARLDSNTLRKVTVYVGEKNYHERQQLRDMFIAQGIKGVVCHSTLAALKTMLVETPPDMLVLSDDFDPTVWEVIRDIRHQKLGDNPFMLITVLLTPQRRANVTEAFQAGVDDIVMKPITPERVRERINLVAFHRAPFVAHGEYVGPERRSEGHPAQMKRIPVLNTLLEKVKGRDFDKETLRAAIDQSLQKVVQAQLDSHSSRLGEVCQRVITAYDTKNITADLQNDLLMLSTVLLEASAMAGRLRDVQLVGLCKTLSDSIVKLADHYDDPSTREIDLIRKITAAFQMAMDGGAGAAEPEPAPETDQSPDLDLAAYAAPS